MDQTIAHYNLLERVGGGSLGEVFRARDTKVGRTVALKVLPPALAADGAARQALLDDARAAATLSHPNISTLFDVGEIEGTGGASYLAYEFATGVTLKQEMGGRSIHPRRAVELAVQIADALADAHGHGLLHGDLRPDAIMVTPKGSAKILDFGMTRWTRGGAVRAQAASEPDTLVADTIPIVAYLSPEQALGGLVDARTDLFSLATILYEMLTGRNPFAAPTPATTVLNVISATPPRPSTINADVTAELDAIVMRALAKEIDKRHQSAAALSAELRSVGAMLDVRSGDAGGDLLPLDDEGGGVGKFVAIAAAGLVLGVAGWWLLR